MRPNATLLDLVLELQALDRLPRAGYLMRGVADPESVAEHTFHVAFLVWAFAEQIDGVDGGRAVAMALVHDTPELRLGDLPRTAARYLPAGAKRHGERSAAAEMLAPLGDRATDLLDELENYATPEARLVKACDKLQLMIKVAVYEGWGAGGLAEFWDNPENFPEPGFEPVDRMVEELRAGYGP